MIGGMRRRSRPAAVLLPVALVAAFGGCGGSARDRAAPTATTTARPATTTDTAPPSGTSPAPGAVPAPGVPRGVPRRGTGRPRLASTTVILRWSRALRAGHLSRAAAAFAVPSRVQNATPVVVLRSRADARAFNAALPCGAVPTDFRGAGGWTIVTFHLTERVGGDCQGAAGQPARCAIRVRHGRITDWFRLPDRPVPRDDGLSTGGGAV